MVKRWWMINKLSNSLESAKIDKEICGKILQGWDPASAETKACRESHMDEKGYRSYGQPA